MDTHVAHQVSNLRLWLIKIMLVSLFFSLYTAKGLDYPGTSPGKVHLSVTDAYLQVENASISGQWKLNAGRIASFTLKNIHSGQSLVITEGHLPGILLDNRRMIDLSSFTSSEPLSIDGNQITTIFIDDESGLSMKWSVSLEDEDNAIIQTLKLKALRDIEIKNIVFLDASVEIARKVGKVDGSVVVCGDLFMAVEHPLAKNEVDSGQVHCFLPRGNVLKAGQSWTYSGVFGAVPPGQLRRGYLYYLERRRAHPYRPFLHYNNWYNVYLSRPVERTNEEECLATIDLFGRKLVRERDVKIDAFVWDDGWDDFNSLWNFHRGFPDGFKNLDAAGKEYGAAQGVWMSPWGVSQPDTSAFWCISY